MEEYVEVLKDYLQGKRDYTKIMFKISGALYRGVSNGRFTWEEGLKVMRQGGTANA